MTFRRAQGGTGASACPGPWTRTALGAAESAAPFDKLAERYDALWSRSAIGRRQREAVWRVVDTLFRPGDSVLDLGCGTGDDALRLMSAGVSVHGIDSSPEMARIARERGIDVRVLPIEGLDQLSGRFDGAISNFGPLNCVARLEPVAVALERLIRPGGSLAVCVMGRFCIWETCRYSRDRAWSKACRRWRRRGSPTSIGVRVNYPSVRRLERIFRPYFRLESWRGIGLLVPPSYVAIAERALGPLAAIDGWIAGLPLLRGMADHRLLVFTRI